MTTGHIIRFEIRGGKIPVAIYEDLQKFRPEDFDWHKQ